MRNLATVAAQVGVLFALMGVGAACRWFRLVDERAVKGMVNILILLVTPCLIVDVFQRPFDPSALGAFAAAFAIALAAHVVAIAVALVAARGDDGSSRPVLRLAIVFSNAGFMGVPLEYAILGPKGVFFGIVWVVMFNFFIWSWGIWQMACPSREASGPKSGTSAPGPDILRMVVNPGTVGLAVGLPLFLVSATLPEVVRSPVHLMAGLNTPLAMIIIGFYLAGADFRRVFATPAAYVALSARLVALPLALIGALYLFRAHLDRTMMLALVIAASAPVGAMVSMFASKYGRDVDLSVGLVSGSTLLSILTMPPVIALAMALL